MKKTLSLLGFLVLILNANAQRHTPVNPIVLVDSITVPYNIIRYIKTEDIKGLNVYRDSKDNNDGTISIVLKDHQVLLNLLKDKMLSLDELKKAHVAPKDQKRPVIFVLDSRMLADTVGMKVPASVNPDVQIIKAEDTPYFKNAFPGSLILMINTVSRIR